GRTPPCASEMVPTSTAPVPCAPATFVTANRPTTKSASETRRRIRNTRSRMIPPASTPASMPGLRNDILITEGEWRDARIVEDVASVVLPKAMITSAQLVAAGAFTPAGNRGGPAASPFTAVPAFCRVQARLTPSADSDIKIEVWLPSSGWNGKFQAVGNRGWG